MSPSPVHTMAARPVGKLREVADWLLLPASVGVIANLIFGGVPVSKDGALGKEIAVVVAVVLAAGIKYFFGAKPVDNIEDKANPR
jgi:hypothetical protein